MEGPYPLTNQSIDQYVAKNRIGNYALGVYGSNLFAVKYAGRSDTCLNSRLKQYPGSPGYTHFMFSYAASAVQAYQKECINFHDYSEYRLDNAIHPDKPEGHPAGLKCPRCGL
jgi:hypothetical protein